MKVSRSVMSDISVIICNSNCNNYTVHGILQVRIMEWIAFLFSRGSSQPRDQTQVYRIAGRRFNYIERKGHFNITGTYSSDSQSPPCLWSFTQITVYWEEIEDTRLLCRGSKVGPLLTRKPKHHSELLLEERDLGPGKKWISETILLISLWLQWVHGAG